MTDQHRGLFDPGLQPERTALAWRRTATAVAVGALVAVRILPEVLGTWALVPAGAGLAAASWVLVSAHRRHRAVHRTLLEADSDRVPLPSGRLPLVLAVLVSGGGAVCLAAVAVLAIR